MPTWYKTNIRYQKEDEAGALKTITECYLIDSVSFTEAEAKAYKLITTGVSDYSVTGITRMPLADIFTYDEGEKWFKAKIIYFSVDERSGKEKRIVNNMLVNADNVQQALDRITENMRNFLIPYDVESVALTTILEVFPHVSEEETEEVPANLRPLSEVLTAAGS